MLPSAFYPYNRCTRPKIVLIYLHLLFKMVVGKKIPYPVVDSLAAAGMASTDSFLLGPQMLLQRSLLFRDQAVYIAFSLPSASKTANKEEREIAPLPKDTVLQAAISLLADPANTYLHFVNWHQLVMHVILQVRPIPPSALATQAV